MAPYGKVFDSIFGSSIMEADVEIRYIWMCLIIAADKEGFIDETIPALARRFNISIESMENAITYFLEPDISSRTPDKEGRRIEPIRESFGWKIINYDYYRQLKDDEQRREYMREYMRNYREGQKKGEPLTPVNNGKQQLAHTDTDTDTDKSTEPFQLPDQQEISESSIPKIKADLKEICEHLYENKIFSEVHAFKNKMLKEKKSERAILHTLVRCALKKEFKTTPWAYCIKIMGVEDGNYNEYEFRKDKG